MIIYSSRSKSSLGEIICDILYGRRSLLYGILEYRYKISLPPLLLWRSPGTPPSPRLPLRLQKYPLFFS
jgi:hypothetical protein